MLMANANRNRSNSFVSSLKWWLLQGHHTHTNNNTENGGSSTVNFSQHISSFHNSSGNVFCGLIPFNKASTQQSFGSSVAVQKLRESKWFKPDEQRIFCAVVECGFIIEIRNSASETRNLIQMQLRKRQRLHSITNNIPQQSNNQKSYCSSCNTQESYQHEANEEFCRQQTNEKLSLCNRHCVSDDDVDELDSNENKTPITWFGVALCKTNKDNKPKAETIEIFSVKIRENGTFKMLKMSLDDIWNSGWELRINNFADKEKPPHNEKDIRNQDHSWSKKRRK